MRNEISSASSWSATSMATGDTSTTVPSSLVTVPLMGPVRRTWFPVTCAGVMLMLLLQSGLVCPLPQRTGAERAENPQQQDATEHGDEQDDTVVHHPVLRTVLGWDIRLERLRCGVLDGEPEHHQDRADEDHDGPHLRLREADPERDEHADDGGRETGDRHRLPDQPLHDVHLGLPRFTWVNWLLRLVGAGLPGTPDLSYLRGPCLHLGAVHGLLPVRRRVHELLRPALGGTAVATDDYCPTFLHSCASDQQSRQPRLCPFESHRQFAGSVRSCLPERQRS